jgi:threonine/homoserine/homoserine lactone efflux protein
MEPILDMARIGMPPAATNAAATFWFGYALMVFVPGPVVAFIGTVATVRGRAGSLPVVAAVSAGSTALAVLAFSLAALGAPDGRLQSAFKASGALLLFFVAWRILRARMPDLVMDPSCGAPLRRDVTFGFLCGFVNPVTAAYLAAFVGDDAFRGMGGALAGIALAGVAAIVTLRSILVVLLFSNNTVRAGVRRLFVPVKTISALALAAMGASASAQFQLIMQ